MSSVLNRFNVLERQTEDRRLEKEIKRFQINWDERTFSNFCMK